MSVRERTEILPVILDITSAKRLSRRFAPPFSPDKFDRGWIHSFIHSFPSSLLLLASRTLLLLHSIFFRQQAAHVRHHYTITHHCDFRPWTTLLLLVAPSLLHLAVELSKKNLQFRPTSFKTVTSASSIPSLDWQQLPKRFPFNNLNCKKELSSASKDPTATIQTATVVTTTAVTCHPILAISFAATNERACR